MAQPPNNNPPVGGSPKMDVGTHEEPEDDVTVLGSPNGLGTNEQKLVRLQVKLTDERKKRLLADARVESAQKKVKRLTDDLQSANANHRAATKKLRADIQGLKTKEKSVLNAVSTSTKLVDGTKADCIRGLRKQISDLLKEVKDGKALRGKVDRLNADVNMLVQEKSAWTKDKQNITRESKVLKKKVDDQMSAKFAHLQRMAELTLKGKEVVLAQGKQKHENSELKNREALEQKKAYASWTMEQRAISKQKDLDRKEETKEKKTQKVAERLQVVSSDMLRTNRINGGTFPNPGLSLQDVSIESKSAFFVLYLLTSMFPCCYATTRLWGSSLQMLVVRRLH
jgi:hypothetical protein